MESLSEGNSVSILRKVASLSEVSMVCVINQSLRLAEGINVNGTGKICICLWEGNLSLIKTGTVSKISNACVRLWNGVKRLTTTPSSLISGVKDDKL